MRVATASVLIGLLAGVLLRAQETTAPLYPNRTNLLVVIGPDRKAHDVQTRADWELRRQHAIGHLEQVMGTVPKAWRTLPLGLRILDEVNLERCLRRKITFQAEPDDRVTAYLFIPRSREGGSPAVLCLHQTTNIGKDEPAGLGGSPDLHYALELAARGYVTLAPDYWTFGEYRMKSYDPYAEGYVSGTMKGIWNHMRCLDLLQSLPVVDPERLGCIGHSLGGHNTLWLGAFDTRLKVMVSSCGFNSLEAYAMSPYGNGSLRNYAQARYMPRMASRYDNDPRKVPWDWPEVLAALAPRAVFISAPTRDLNFVVDGVRPCVNAAQRVYSWMGATNRLVAVYPDAEHSFPRDVREQAYAFLDRNLQHSPDKDK